MTTLPIKSLPRAICCGKPLFGVPHTVRFHVVMFEPFFSTKPTTGTGLGLDVVKRLVKLYGGTIGVESEVDEGTRFSVKLPNHFLATDKHGHTRTLRAKN